MSARRPPSWSEVLGLKPRQSLRNHPRAARLAGALILLLAALLGLSVLRILVELLGQFGQALEGTGYAARNAQSEAVRNYGLALAAVIGVIFAIWRALVAQKQVHVAEQGLTTDRINKAVEGLGADKVVKRITETPRYQKQDGEWLRDQNGALIPARRPDGTEIVDRDTHEMTEPNLEVRIGAFLSLERIAEDSKRDRDRILRILCAYLRGNGKTRTIPEWSQPDIRLSADAKARVKGMNYWHDETQRHYSPHRERPRADIETALFVLRDTFGLIGELKDVDFAGLSLQALKLNNVNLSAAILDNADFTGSAFHQLDLCNAQLTLAEFQGAEIRNSSLTCASMPGTSFSAAKLTTVSLNDAHLHYAWLGASFLSDCSMQNAKFIGANFLAARLFRCDLSTAHLSDVSLEGTRFQQCRFDGALWDAPKFDGETGFLDCTMAGAAVLNCDFRDLPQLAPFLSDLFGDASSVPPDGSAPEDPGWPAHWSREKLSPEAFDRAWQDWTRVFHPGVRRLALNGP